MSQAIDSPVLSRLFTQGRHRNASVILLLLYMFPKGKYNTDISRNAQYTVMFRSPNDRKQIDIRAEQIFAKDKSRFMEVYHRETARPYGYIMVDSHPQTPSEKQVVADIFGTCHCYPYILPASVETQPTTRVGLKAPRKRKQRTVNPANKRSKKGWEPQSTWKPFEETAEGESDLSDGELSAEDISDEELTDGKLSDKESNIQEYNPPTPFKSGKKWETRGDREWKTREWRARRLP